MMISHQHVNNLIRKLLSRLTVLVTGAAGFVGSHVSLALKRRGDGVLGLDNFNSNYDKKLKRDRQGLLGRAGVHVIDGDINDKALLDKIFNVIAFTHVMHLAAQAGVRYAMQNPNSYVDSNIAEKDRTDQPASLYAATKKAGEAIAHTYNHIYGLSITGLRDMLRGKQSESMRPPDRGSVARDFTYIDDIVKGCLAALDTAKKSTGSGGKKRGTA
ncbi:hypothetical protein JRO89_XS13G0049500 [Xanthoceras sorbifolium]|uniref:NAD-dependent epimerase/dehydratase domain-containing protein n=1 Tax=Xanthoceras sorbifolium TaxID=99658 RepID=A0ABQ8H6M2_9ROSI|nr:hypothetical protein JRO89_XS13G0049500 [Xanthoceras sorbifolium]